MRLTKFQVSKMRNNKIKFKGRIIVFILIFSLFVFLNPLQNNISLVQAASGIYNEDFSTTTYMDGAFTNVSGWGDDSISITNKQPIIVSSLSMVLSGRILDICVDGNYAYCGTIDNEFLAINITNPYSPVKKNSCSIDGIGYSVTIAGNYAYVATNDQGLKIVNITNPGSPNVVGSFNTDGNAHDVIVAGDYAFIADGSYGLKVIDISDPALPTSGVAWAYDTPDVATGLILNGDYVYITDTSSIQIVDISDPTSPVFAGEYTAITSTNKLCIFGDLAFIANSDGLVILNITAPSSPQYLSTFGTVGLIDIVVDGDHIYVSGYDNNFQVIDITNPLNPVIVGTCLMPALSQGLFLSGCYVYAAPYDLGLRVLEVTDINEELSYKGLVSSITGYTLEGVQQICIKGDYLFIAEAKGLLILNISDPEVPKYIGSYIYTAIPNSPYSIAVEGNYAFLSDKTGRLTVVNVTDITNPTFAGSCDTPGIGWDIEICGNYLFMADWHGGLHSIDISDPTNPVIIDTYALDGFSMMITVSGDYLYLSVASGLSINGLLIFDISDPASIVYLSTYSVTDPRTLYISGNYGYLAADDDGLIILDMSIPSDPEYVNSTVFNNVWDVKISGDNAFFTRTMEGFYVSDISNASDFVIIDYHGTSSVQERFIEFHGDYAYISSTSNGLKIYEVRKNKVKQFDSPCIAQSTEFYSNAHTEILNATLISNATTPIDTDIEFYLSADNGVHWEQVTNNTLHSFTNIGYQLKWKAVLASQNASFTPYLHSLEIEYVAFLESPELYTPDNPSADFDYTPTFTWFGINGEIGYLFQLDTSTDFITPVINITLPSTSTSYTPDTPLTSGTKYWRVAGIDSNGELGLFSDYYLHTILTDSLDPNIDHPVDIVYEVGHTGNEITWNPNDENPATYTIRVDAVTVINHANWDGGSITYNVDGRSEGSYWIDCIVYDFEGNSRQDGVQVDVISKISPTIDDVADFGYDEGSTGNAITWHPSDYYPDYYTISRNGAIIEDGPWLGGDIVVDIDGLTHGVYTYDCTVNDTDGLEANDTVIVTVTDIVNPILNSPGYINYNEGEVGNNIIWVATDSNPATYIVYKDGVLFDTDTWTSGSSIVISVDGFSTGVYNLTIVVYDLAGHIAKNTVIVDVNPAISEFNPSIFFATISITVIYLAFHIKRKNRRRN